MSCDKKVPKKTALNTAGVSAFWEIEVEVVRFLRLGFPEGWVPSAESGGSYAGLHGQLASTIGWLRLIAKFYR